MKQKGYIGTYTKRESRGIYSFEYDNGEIGNLHLWAQIKNPKYLCDAGEYLASICEFEKGAGVALFDFKGNKVDELEFEQVSSCYLAFHKGKLYTANYHEGCVHIIGVQDGKLSLIKRIDIEPNAGTHQIIFWEDKFIVPCLLLDTIFVFDEHFEMQGQISFESGAGPRHGIMMEQSPYLYVVGEISNQLYTVDLQSLKVIGRQRLVNEHEPASAAAIRYYDNRLYVSIRGADVISVLDIDDRKMPTLVKNIPSFGKHPRDFIIVDHYLLIANRESDRLVSVDLNGEILDLNEGIKEVDAKREQNLRELKANCVLEGAFEAIAILM